MEKFWEFKSKKYPRPFDADIIEETRRNIKIISWMGVGFNGKNIMDIGCGTGVYSLPLAEIAEKVVCMDISCGMLSALKEEAGKHMGYLILKFLGVTSGICQ